MNNNFSATIIINARQLPDNPQLPKYELFTRLSLMLTLKTLLYSKPKNPQKIMSLQLLSFQLYQTHKSQSQLQFLALKIKFQVLINHKTNSKEMDHQIFFQNTKQEYFDQTRENNSHSDQEYSIEMFLNDDVLINEQDKKCNKMIDNTSHSQISTQKHPQSQQMNETPTAMKRKSIFHNFQKHLITLLKRVINISQYPLDNMEGTQLIRLLWLAFLKCKSFNKKIMHTVFGCAGNKNSYDELKSISEQFKEFEQVTSKYQAEQIFQAQKLIRNIVVSQTKNLSRSSIESNTNISRFDQFYEYFLSFLQQIEFGQLSKRMSKIRKVDLVKKLAKKPQTF